MKLEDKLWKAYQMGINDAVERCGYNTTVLHCIKQEKRKDFMEEYPQPEFKTKEQLIDSINGK